jgi:hypothetical protein
LIHYTGFYYLFLFLPDPEHHDSRTFVFPLSSSQAAGMSLILKAGLSHYVRAASGGVSRPPPQSPALRSGNDAATNPPEVRATTGDVYRGAEHLDEATGADSWPAGNSGVYTPCAELEHLLEGRVWVNLACDKGRLVKLTRDDLQALHKLAVNILQHRNVLDPGDQPDGYAEQARPGNWWVIRRLGFVDEVPDT